MVDLKKVSQEVMNAVRDIAQLGGDKKKIDSKTEANKLANLLAGTTGKADSEYLQGVQFEYQERAASDAARKSVRNFAKLTPDKKTIDSEVEANRLVEMLEDKTNSLSEADVEYIKAVLIRSGYGDKLTQGEFDNFTEPECGGYSDVDEKADESTVENNTAGNEPNKPNESAPVVHDNPKPTTKDEPTLNNGESKIIHVPISVPVSPKVENNIDNSLNQDGQVNVKGDNATVIINYGVQADEISAEGGEIKNDDPAEVETPALGIKEAVEARKNGADVADYLVGVTNDAEEKLVTDIIKKEINSDNVLEFLRGYENNKGRGDHFFEQLRSEYDFEEKQNLMHKVAQDLSDYIKNKYGVDSNQAKEIAIILQETYFREEHTKTLDGIVKSELGEYKSRPYPFPRGAMALQEAVVEKVKDSLE